MTSSKHRKASARVVVIASGVAFLLASTGGSAPAFAAPENGAASASRAAANVDLRLGSEATRRLAMAEGAPEGAAQEGDREKPRDMQTATTPPPVSAQTSAAAAQSQPASQPDQYAFLKDWPFWVIVGGVIVAGAAGYMIYSNSQEQSPCAGRFVQGCFGDR